jgi:hypothetical protein
MTLSKAISRQERNPPPPRYEGPSCRRLARGRPKNLPLKRFYSERFAENCWFPGLAGRSLPARGRERPRNRSPDRFLRHYNGSKNSWKKDFASILKAKDVFVCFDVGNVTGAEKIAKDVEAIASSVRILRLPGFIQPEQDITVWFVTMAGRTDEEKAPSVRKVVSARSSIGRPPVRAAGARRETWLCTFWTKTRAAYLDARRAKDNLYMAHKHFPAIVL